MVPDLQMALIWRVTKGMAAHGVAHYDILEGALKIIISNIYHLCKNNHISSFLVAKSRVYFRLELLLRTTKNIGKTIWST